MQLNIPKQNMQNGRSATIPPTLIVLMKYYLRLQIKNVLPSMIKAETLFKLEKN